MANLKEIADQSGVCVETVSRVLKGKYKGRTEKSRQIMTRVMEVAERLNYRPNNAARAMRTQNTGLIGVVTEEAGLRTHPVITEVLQGANQIFKDNGYILTISSLTGIEENTLESRIFKEHLLDGLIILDITNEESINRMLNVIPHCIMVNTNMVLPACCIRRNEYAAGLLMSKQLSALGYKQAFYFEASHDQDLSSNHYSVADRLRGLEHGCKGNNITFNVINIGTGEMLSWLVENKKRLTLDSAIIAGHNLRLFCLSSALAQLDMVAGQHFGLASLDDETGLLASFNNLTRVSFPRVEIGRLAGKMMIDLIAGRKDQCQSLEIEGKWIEGTTMKKVR